MDNDVEAVVLACRGTLASWSPAVEAVAYEQARVNAESPLDRGAALRRRVEELSGRRRHPVARGRVRPAGRRAGLAAGHDRLRVPQPGRRARAALRRRPGGARGSRSAPASRSSSPPRETLCSSRARCAPSTARSTRSSPPASSAPPAPAPCRPRPPAGWRPTRAGCCTSAPRASGSPTPGCSGCAGRGSTAPATGRRPPHLLPDEEWPSLRGLGAFLGVGSPTLPVAG